MMKVWEMLGKAALKSKRISAASSSSRLTLMACSSTSTTFASMDLWGRKPRCSGEIHFSSSASHRKRAALAINLLSQLTIERGRVALASRPLLAHLTDVLASLHTLVIDQTQGSATRKQSAQADSNISQVIGDIR